MNTEFVTPTYQESRERQELLAKLNNGGEQFKRLQKAATKAEATRIAYQMSNKIISEQLSLQLSEAQSEELIANNNWRNYESGMKTCIAFLDGTLLKTDDQLVELHSKGEYLAVKDFIAALEQTGKIAKIGSIDLSKHLSKPSNTNSGPMNTCYQLDKSGYMVVYANTEEVFFLKDNPTDAFDDDMNDEDDESDEPKELLADEKRSEYPNPNNALDVMNWIIKSQRERVRLKQGLTLA